MKSKKILLFIIALIGSFIVNIKGVFALNIDVKDVKVNKKGGNISLGDISFSGKNINSSIEFNDLNDYVIYQITLKNNDKEDYTIDSIKDNNDNENIDVSYSYDNKKISSKGTKNIYVTLKYNKKLYNKDSISLNDLTITLNLLDSKGNSGSAVINPTTRDNIKRYTLLFIVSLIIILFGLLLIKRRKSKGFLILLLALVPTIVIAKESLSFSIKFTNITIKGEMLPYTVSIMDSNGNPTERTVLYGNPIGELPAATKEGYTFDKYVDQDGNEVNKDTIVTGNVTVTPKFNIETYDIEYDYSGGFATNPIHYTVEDDITLSKPIRLGYTFLGWTGTNINEVQNSVRIQNSTGNLSFVAHWSTNQNTPYKVIHRYPNLDGTYEDVVQNLEGPTDEEVTVALLDRYGFRGPQQLSKVKIVAVENEEDIPTVTYTYTRVNYRLTINNDVQTTFTNTSYPYQTEITLTAKDKENYEFTGWTNGSTTKTITFNLTENTEILPIYSRIKYTVTYNAADGQISPTTQEVNAGESITTLPLPEAPTGKEFDAWYTGLNDGTKVTSPFTPNSDVEIFARYKNKTFTVSFNTDGGSNVASQTIEYGNKVTRPTTDPTKTNYAFVNWYTNDSYNTLFDFDNTTITSNTTIYAKFKADTFPTVFSEPGECTFKGSGGVLTGNNCSYANGTNKYIDTGVNLYNEENHDKDYEIGFTIVSYDPSIQVSQATFMNTKLEGNNYPGLVFRRRNAYTDLDLSSRRTSSSNTQLFFDYSTIETVKIYRIKNEETGNQEIFYSINGENKVKVNDLSAFNPEFDLSVWFGATPTDASATAAQRILKGTLKDMYIKVGTYTEDDTEKYTITFNANGGTVSPTRKNITVGQAVGTLPTPTAPTGKSFIGWYTGLNDGEEVTSSYIPNTNKTIYARYYTNVSGATVAPSSINVLKDASETITVSNVEEEYTFTSNNTNIATVDSTGKVTGKGVGTTTITITGTTSGKTKTVNVTVESSTYTVTLNPNGGTLTTTSITKDKGTAIGELPTPTAPTGKEFDGWYTELTDGTKITSSYTPNANVTIYARYVDNPCGTFATDSWSTIRDNLESNSSYYAVGCEKEVEMDMDDDGTNESYAVRLANTSTPEVCSTEGYSQTACGFVIEFVDIVTMRKMKNSTGGNSGGWKETTMVDYLNSDFYNKLPNNLQSVIIPTYPIISGSGSGGNSKDITSDDINKDKVFLLAAKEINANTSNDNKYYKTNTLDYYKSHNSNTYRDKYDLLGESKTWWLRTADKNSSYGFIAIKMNAQLVESSMANSILGVAPAFRIGTMPSFTVTFDTDEGSSVVSQTITYGEKATRPTTNPTKSGYTFDNWYTDDTYTTVFDFDNTVITSATTIYAKFDELIVCKRATNFHQEVCDSSYCSSAGFTQDGSKGTNIITYGKSGTQGVLASGDAFTCDVNGDNVFDELEERFYYVSDYFNTKTLEFEEDTAVLIYYNNVNEGVADNNNNFKYANNGCNYKGPITASLHLPTTAQWKNVSLKNLERQILGENKSIHNSLTTYDRTLETFNYNGYSARLLTSQELMKSCNLSEINTGEDGELDNCNFLLENTKYSSNSINTYGHWLETADADTEFNIAINYVFATNRKVINASAYHATWGGIRPTIEVPKTKISY